MSQYRSLGLGRIGPVVAVVLPFIAHAIVAQAHLDALQIALSATVGSCAAVAVHRYLAQRHKGLPFLPVALLQFYVYWAFPLLGERESAAVAAVGSITAALIGANVAIASLLVGYLAAKPVSGAVARAVAAIMPKREVDLGLAFWPALIAVAWVNGGGAEVVAPEVRLALLVVASPFPLLAYAGFRGLKNERERWLLPGATAVIALFGLGTGMLESVLRPMVAYIVFSVYFRRRVPVRAMVLGVVLVVLLNPVKHAYRDRAWGEGGRGAVGDTAASLRMWADAFQDTWLKDQSVQSATMELGSRVNELPLIAETMRRTPGVVPYDKFQAWPTAMTSFIPRAVWPDKPNYTELFNARYSVLYGFLSEASTRTTTLTIPLVAEGFWNWGWVGIAVVGLVAGAATAVKAAMSTPRTWSLFALGLALLTTMHANGALFSQIGGLFQVVMGSAVATWSYGVVSAMRRGLSRRLGALGERSPRLGNHGAQTRGARSLHQGSTPGFGVRK